METMKLKEKEGLFNEESNDKKRGIVPGKAGMDSDFFHGSAFLYQIGRASCRERV